MRIREEVSYAEASPLNPHVLPYGSVNLRLSSQKQSAELRRLGARRRTAQLATPLVLDGRYNPESSGGPVVNNDWAAATRALLDLLFKRKADYSFASAHTKATLGDMRSFGIEFIGPNDKEAQRALGCKARSFILGTRQSGRRNSGPLFLQARLLVGEVESMSSSSSSSDELFPRRQFGTFDLSSSVVRIADVGTDISSDLSGTIVNDVVNLTLRCNRNVTGDPSPTAGVKLSSGDIVSIPAEPFVVDERWDVTVQAETFDASRHSVAQAIVDEYWTSQVKHQRYNLRFDFGASNKAVMVPIKDAGNSWVLPVLLPAVGPFVAPGIGAETQASTQVFPVWAEDADVGKGRQFVPKIGDRIRYHGVSGIPAADTELAYGGYNLEVGGAFLVTDGVNSDFPAFVGFSAKDILFVISSNAGGPVLGNDWPDPNILIAAHFKGYKHTPVPSTFERLIPGGFSVEIRDAVINRSEGLKGDSPAYTFTFATDQRSEVIVDY